MRSGGATAAPSAASNEAASSMAGLSMNAPEVIIRGQQRLDFAPQALVAGAGLADKRIPRVLIARQRVVVDPRNLLQSLRRHRPVRPPARATTMLGPASSRA